MRYMPKTATDSPKPQPYQDKRRVGPQNVVEQEAADHASHYAEGDEPADAEQPERGSQNTRLDGACGFYHNRKNSVNLSEPEPAAQIDTRRAKLL